MGVSGGQPARFPVDADGRRDLPRTCGTRPRRAYRGAVPPWPAVAFGDYLAEWAGVRPGAVAGRRDRRVVADDRSERAEVLEVSAPLGGLRRRRAGSGRL